MEFIAPTGAVYIAGAYLTSGGTRLRCGLLLVKKDQPDTEITVTDPATNQELRVKLPEQGVKPAGNARFSFETLEVIS